MAGTWIERDASVVWHGFTQMDAFLRNSPLVIESAEGHELIDVDGKRYLDAISSLWVNTLGHRVPELDQAVIDQLGRVAHSTLLGHGNTTVVELSEALAEVVPVDEPHFVYASDGAAAVEQALKIAFQYWKNEGSEGKTTYMAFGGAYHGDTVGSLSVGGDGFGSSTFDDLRFPVVRAPGFDDPAFIDAAIELLETTHDELAAVVVEPLVQGAAGIRVAPTDGFKDLEASCRDLGVLLICDEVATGFGRTGSLFASEICGIRPDIMALGKGLTGGYLPMSVTVTSGAIYKAFLGEDLGPKTLYHGHSYGGNALAAAVARKHLELIRAPEILANVNDRAEQLKRLLDERVAPLAGVADIRTQGLMCGVELAPGSPGERRGRLVCAGAVARGVLLRPLGDVVVLMPPLTITEPEIERIVEALAESIEEVCAP
ncbi:MAG TPA: adenosylmethionine--8-amino-7-oxononanoate transaminase [Actinomycetota bacterium]|nr:adenosylmethionine--8-amino-7-oxononanoate transaminase [Actinomycetota bacterium]